MKDTVELIKALDLRMVNSNQKQKEQINEIIKKIRDIEQNVIKELSKIDKSDGSFNVNFQIFEDTIKNLEDQVIGVEKEFLILKNRILDES